MVFGWENLRQVSHIVDIQFIHAWLQSHLRKRRSFHKNPFDTPSYCLVSDIRLNAWLSACCCVVLVACRHGVDHLYSHLIGGISGQEAEQPHVLFIRVPFWWCHAGWAVWPQAAARKWQQFGRDWMRIPFITFDFISVLCRPRYGRVAKVWVSSSSAACVHIHELGVGNRCQLVFPLLSGGS